MSCCTKKIAKICNPIGTCAGSTLELPYTGLADGTYSVFLSFLAGVVRLDVVAALGKLIIPTGTLNESYTYEGQVYKDNVPVLFATDYDAFRFTTYPGAGRTNITFGGSGGSAMVILNNDGSGIFNNDNTQIENNPQ